MTGSLLRTELVQPKDLPKLSPSSINLYDQDPALWVLKHFYGQTSEFNIYAMRGVALEDALNAYLSTYPTIGKPKALQGASKGCISDFGEKAFFWGDDELLEDIEAKIEPWLGKCVEALDSIGKEEMPTQQVEIFTEIEGVPIRGFIDYTYSDLQVDLKTANTVKTAVTRGPRKGMLPSDKKANVRQQAIYNKATGLETSLLYVSPEEYYHHILSKEELDTAMNDVVVVVKKMKELLELPIKDVIAITEPKWKTMNYSFYWDAPLRRLANQLWGHLKEDEKEVY